MKRVGTFLVIASAVWLGTTAPLLVSKCHGLPPSTEEALAKNKQVIVASTRKDGTLSEPAEVWFLYHQGKILVASQTNSWRVRRIKAGRTRAKLWVGNVDGPSFMATGKIVSDPKLQQLLLDKHAEKYASDWSAWKDNFTIGLKNGTRVLIEFTPDEASGAKTPPPKPTPQD